MNPNLFTKPPVILKDLPSCIRGFVCLGSDYEPVIVLNSSLSREQQRETYRHEMRHILNGELWDEDYREYCG